MQFGFAYLDIEHIWSSLHAYALARTKLVREATFSTHEEKCVNLEGFSSRITLLFLQECLWLYHI